MAILLVSAALLAVSVCVVCVSKECGAVWFCGMFLIALSALILLVLGPMIPACLHTTRLEIAAFNSTKTTIAIARDAGGPGLEAAAIQLKIIEQNQWLAKTQKANMSMFGLWVPDEVMKLKPIK